MSSYNGLTVQDVLNYIINNNIPKTAKICYQRIEDSYFDGVDISGMSRGVNNEVFPPGSKATPWQTLKIKGLAYHEAKTWNEKIEQGKLVIDGKLNSDEVGSYFWKDEFKNIRKPYTLTEDFLFDQYIESSNIFYDKENKALCITAHN